LRLWWFLDFVETTLRLCFVENYEDREIGPWMAKAYASTLGTRHAWLIRKGVMTALASVPTRDTLVHLMQCNQEQDLQTTQEHLKRITDALRTYFRDNNLMEIL
jgi:hypothetical protein